MSTLDFRVISIAIEFKESIRGYDHDLITEFPELDHLRKVAKSDLNKLLDYRLTSICNYHIAAIFYF